MHVPRCACIPASTYEVLGMYCFSATHHSLLCMLPSSTNYQGLPALSCEFLTFKCSGNIPFRMKISNTFLGVAVRHTTLPYLNVLYRCCEHCIPIIVISLGHRNLLTTPPNVTTWKLWNWRTKVDALPGIHTCGTRICIPDPWHSAESISIAFNAHAPRSSVDESRPCHI